jgi:hypothetical protein
MPSKIMLLAESKYSSIHLLYFCHHIYRVSIVGSIIWILYFKPTSFVPPGIGQEIGPIDHDDPILGIALMYVIKMVGPVMALEYASPLGVGIR